MYIYDMIIQKREGKELNPKDIKELITEYTAGNVPDYQMSALLMAIYFQKMTEEEIYALTDAMTKSGDTIDLSPIEGKKIDKHSTGGVGDKTSLIVLPLVASMGVKIAKMSGRGLGHTGGTIDKLESIPGYNTSLSIEKFFEIVNDIGISIIGQTGNLAPADKKLYALRDVTGTVDSPSLIASSIMSKKLASGADSIVLDVKVGSGAFMKTVREAIDLSKIMVQIGTKGGKETIALVTNMDSPLGNNIGNSLEVIEAIYTLKGEGPKDLEELSIELGATMAHLAGVGDMDSCKKTIKEKIENQEGLQKLKELVKAHGGDPSYIENPDKFLKDIYSKDVIATEEGYLNHMDTDQIGKASVHLGAGRMTKDQRIDHYAGITLLKKTGDSIKKGDILATIYSNTDDKILEGEKALLKGIKITEEKPPEQKLIYAKVTKDHVEEY